MRERERQRDGRWRLERALSTAGIVTECFGFHLLIFVTRPIITLPLDFFHIAFSNIAASISIHCAGRGIRYSYLLPPTTHCRPFRTMVPL